MPAKLREYLPDADEALRKELFGSVESAVKYPHGSIVREGVIRGMLTSPVDRRPAADLNVPISAAAYGDTMKVMVVVAAAVSLVPLLLALAIPEWYLGNRQNAVDGTKGPDFDELDADVDEGRGAVRSQRSRSHSVRASRSRMWQGWRRSRTLSLSDGAL
jgi:hypothetical protein